MFISFCDWCQEGVSDGISIEHASQFFASLLATATYTGLIGRPTEDDLFLCHFDRPSPPSRSVKSRAGCVVTVLDEGWC